MPGGGRASFDQQFPGELMDKVMTSIAGATFANHAELAGNLTYLSGAGWEAYSVTQLPALFTAALCIWVDVSWGELEEGSEIPIELVAELLTPSLTATFSIHAPFTIHCATTAGFTRTSITTSVKGTLHEAGLHVLSLNLNTGAQIGQYLRIDAGPWNPQPVATARETGPE
jgi:hypothetical protein